MTDLGSDPVRTRLGELAPLLRARDPDAVEEAYRLTESMLAAVAFSILGDHAAAQDVAHDTFLRLLDHAPRLRADDGAGLRAWLVTTARNRARDVVQSGRSRYEEPTAALPDLDDPFVDVADLALGPDPELLAALGRLTADQRDAVVMFHVAGMSAREISTATGRERSAVYGVLRRAEQSLRTQLDHVHSSESGSSR